MLTQREEWEPGDLFQDVLHSDAEFSSFLEALASEDAGTSACGVVPPVTAQHSPSKPFQSDSIDNEHGIDLSEGNDSLCVPVLAVGSHLSTALSVSPTAKHTRLERTRAKNRRAQKAYRQRLKVLFSQSCAVFASCTFEL